MTEFSSGRESAGPSTGRTVHRAAPGKWYPTCPWYREGKGQALHMSEQARPKIEGELFSHLGMQHIVPQPLDLGDEHHRHLQPGSQAN